MVVLILLSPIYLIIFSTILFMWLICALFYAISLLLPAGFAKSYIFNVMVSFDQTANALTLGDPDETISGRFGRRWPDSWFSKLLNTLFGVGHVQQAIEPDEGSDDLIK